MIPQLITGKEQVQQGQAEINSLVNFYRAFNQQQMSLMQENWLQTDEACMANPLGGIKRGWNEISQVYDRIFNGPAEVYVEFYDYRLYQGEDMFTVVGRERGYFSLKDVKLELSIRTSRIYKLSEDGWKQLHHHGSIDKPGLLERYQNAVIKNT